MPRRKPNARPYTRTNPLTYAIIKEWYLKKLALGTNKTIAREVGISAARVTQLCAQIRRDFLASPQENPWGDHGGWASGSRKMSASQGASNAATPAG